MRRWAKGPMEFIESTFAGLNQLSNNGYSGLFVQIKFLINHGENSNNEMKIKKAP